MTLFIIAINISTVVIKPIFILLCFPRLLSSKHCLLHFILKPIPCLNPLVPRVPKNGTPNLIAFIKITQTLMG